MKKIFLSLLAIVLYSGSLSAQTLMSDEEHRIMMNDFAIQLNNTLTYNCPQGVTVDQYKRGIVDGTYTLSQMMQDNLIINFTQALKDYGSQFAAAKGLTANTDALKYFYSTFAPSTAVQNGKLVESPTSAGLTATEMWTCALETFGTSNCGSSVLVSDKNNLTILATTSVNKLTAVAGNIGMLVMLNGFSDCMSVISVVNDVMSISTFLDKNQILIDTNFDTLSEASETELIPLMQNMGFHEVQLFNNRLSKTAFNVQKINEIANYEMSTYNLATIESTPIFVGLQLQLESKIFSLFRKDKRCKDAWQYHQATNGDQCDHGGDWNVEVTIKEKKIHLLTITKGSIMYECGINCTFKCGCGRDGGSYNWF